MPVTETTGVNDATSLDLYRQLVAAKDDEVARLGEQLAVKDEQLRQANLLIAELSRRIMEVNWIGATRISVDLADMTDLLWPDRRLALCARLMDTTNANYQALSHWSPVFIVADDAASCGLPANAPDLRASSPDPHAGRRRGRRWWRS